MATKRKKGKKKSSGSEGRVVSKTKVKVDLGDDDDSPRGRYFTPGDYPAKVKSASAGESRKKNTPQVTFVYTITKGKYKGEEIRQNCNLLPQSLWVLRNALKAMGLKVPKKLATIDLTACKGKKLGISVDDDEYDNKTVSRVVDTFPVDEVEARKAKDDVDLADDDEDEDEDLDEEDEDDEDEDDDDEEDDEDEDEDDDEDDEDDDDMEDIDLDEV